VIESNYYRHLAESEQHTLHRAQKWGASKSDPASGFYSGDSELILLVKSDMFQVDAVKEDVLKVGISQADIVVVVT